MCLEDVKIVFRNNKINIKKLIKILFFDVKRDEYIYRNNNFIRFAGHNFFIEHKTIAYE